MPLEPPHNVRFITQALNMVTVDSVTMALATNGLSLRYFSRKPVQKLSTWTHARGGRASEAALSDLCRRFDD